MSSRSITATVAVIVMYLCFGGGWRDKDLMDGRALIKEEDGLVGRLSTICFPISSVATRT